MADTAGLAPKKAQDASRRRLSRKIVAITGIGALAVAAAAGILLSRSAGSDLKADVPFDSYGKNGHPAPRVIFDKAHDPVVLGVRFVHSNNPFEVAQQLLWLAANTVTVSAGSYNAYVGLNHVSYGSAIVLRSGTVLYHVPRGSRFMPVRPSRDEEAGKFVVPPGDVALIKNPRYLENVFDAPDWIVATLASDTDSTNRATDIKQDYWIRGSNPNSPFDSGGGRVLTYHGQPSFIGDASVNVAGNLVVGNRPTNQISVIQIVKRNALKRVEAGLGLAPERMRTDSPPPPTG